MAKRWNQSRPVARVLLTYTRQDGDKIGDCRHAFGDVMIRPGEGGVNVWFRADDRSEKIRSSWTVSIDDIPGFIASLRGAAEVYTNGIVESMAKVNKEAVKK